MTKRKIHRRRKTNQSGRGLHHETLEKRELLAVDLAAETGPQLISVTADSGEILDLDSNNLVNVAPTELNFIFGSDTPIDPATLGGIQIIGSGGDGTFGDGNEIVIEPGFIGVGDASTGQTVVARFAQTLADDQYAIEIAGFDDTDPLNPVVGLRNTDGELFLPENPLDPARPSQTVLLNVELGPLVVAVVPQPIEGVGTARTQLRDVVDVFFNNDPLSNPDAGTITTTTSTLPVVNPDFFQLVFTGDTIERTDDSVVMPSLVEYDPVLNRARLTFGGGDLSDLANTFSGDTTGVGTFRLRVGSGEAIEVAGAAAPSVSLGTGDAGDTFGTFESLGVIFGSGSESLVVPDRAIQSVQDVVAPLPGAGDAVGLRDNRRDALFSGRFDSITGIQTFEYNFAEFYGFDPLGNPLSNAITPAQEQRVREIFDLLSERLGVSFVETEDSGLQIAVGDLRVLGLSIDTGSGTPLLASSINEQDPSEGLLILDGGETFFDGFGVSPNANPSFFVEALRGVSNLLGLGNTFGAPAGDATGGSSLPEFAGNAQNFLTPGLPAGLPVEPDFFTRTNIIAGQALLRPESNDVDIYRFQANSDGTLTAETFAQRLEDSSLLDTNLTLFQQLPTGEVVQIASNDDFFSEDSFLEVKLEVNRDANAVALLTNFFVAVSASGNQFDGDVEGSGFGGRSEGTYELRLNFVPEDQTGNTITDTTGSALDGDGDGVAGGNFNFFFRVAPETQLVPGTGLPVDQPRTIFVDALDGDDVNNTGELGSPLSTIQAAFGQAGPDDIVRILPNGGADGDLATTGDNVTFAIGTGGPGLQTLRDGSTFEVPQGVSVQIDAGAILKFQNAGISVGSSSADDDRSLGSLQVLGTPQDSVTITSFNDASTGLDTNPLITAPQPGDFAGIEFRNDIDFSEGLPVFESEGIFLDFVSHADIRFGGGAVSVGSPAVTPLETTQRRPTFIFNTISNSAGAAISADPDSFLETTFNEPIFQRAGAFTSDFTRVGPEIFGNTLVNNAINGLFVRVVTPFGGAAEPQTVSGRFDDTDIVHVLSSALVLQGQPGGPLLLEDRPDIQSFAFADGPAGGSLIQGNDVQYRLTFITTEGRESLASLPSSVATVGASGSVTINNIPPAPEGFTGRRIYRLNSTGGYDFIGQIDQSSSSFTDSGQAGRGLLPDAALAETRLLPRFDARLSIDPGTIVAIENGRIEAGFGSDFFAEGTAESPIIFTSLADDRFGAGGTFDTNNDPSEPQPGDFEGLIFRQDSTASLDFVTVNFAGGGVAAPTGFLSSNAVEILQADVRIANSSFEFNADGVDGAPGISSTREGRGFNSAATIFVRGSQPILLNNEIVNNDGPAISINADALDFTNNLDTGRSTGPSEIIVTDQSNQGPLIEGNVLANNAINGLVVRGEVLQTEVVFDDTDIVHVVTEDIVTDNVSFRGGLRLRSDPDQSLVVAFDNGASLIGSGELTEIVDRVGGTLQILGQPGFPVILTSINDDTAGAGFTPSGLAQTDTNNDAAVPVPGDFGGVVLSPFVNDRNVAFVLETEPANAASVLLNASADDAQQIGVLASDTVSSDENQRLGFNVRGTLASDDDVDVFSFEADGGTTVFVDIDDTTFGLDTIVELIDVNDNVLASSDNSFAEGTDPSTLFASPALEPGSLRPLPSFGPGVVETGNPLDAGFQITLPGTSVDTEFFLRVRSANGSSSGQYQLSVRLGAADEIAGSTVQGADIRFANDAITVSSAPLRSPLLDTASENLNSLADGTPVDVDGGGLAGGPATATDLGNLLTTDTGSLTVTGSIGNFDPVAIDAGTLFPEEDVDFFRVDLFNQDIAPDLFDNEMRFVTATFDVDFADGVGRPNTTLSVFNQFGQLILVGRDSSIADDVGRPLEGDDFENLDAGSAGALDPFIGPVELPEGTYFVAVSSAVAVPEVLDQFFEPTPTAPLVRSIPVNSVRAVSSGSFVGEQFSAEQPVEMPIFDPTFGGIANESVVDFTLSDARLFVSFSGGINGQNDNTLAAVNPFTGVVERLIGQSDQPLGDIAARRDGELLGFSTPDFGEGAVNNGNTGNFLNLSPIDSSVQNLGDDGIVFQENNDAGTDTQADGDAQFIANGIAFPLGAQDGQTQTINTTAIGGGERFFAVGNRDNVPAEVPLVQTQNLLFQFVSQDGEVTSQGSTDGDAERDLGDFGAFSPALGAGTANIETGIVDTGQLLLPTSVGPGDAGNLTGLGVLPTFVQVDPLNPVVPGPIAAQGNDNTSLIGVTDRGGVFFFDTNNAMPGPAGTLAAGLPNVIPTTFLGTITPDAFHVGAQTDPTTGGVIFTGLAFGPRSLGSSAFRQTLFATTIDGYLYALEFDGTTTTISQANILVNGRSAIQLTFQGTTPTTLAGGAFAPNGLAFSNLEENIFDPSADPGGTGGSLGRGLDPTFDGSRIDVTGGGSFFFGFEIDGNVNNNTIARADGDPLGELSPGGAQGQLISRPFSLAEFGPGDQPTLFFNFDINVEDDDDFLVAPGTPNRQQNDSLRVFAAGDDGQFQLIATNNNFRNNFDGGIQTADEFDEFANNGGIAVQELFDDGPGFRQARVDLSPFAGDENVRIRFEFSTSGNFQNNFNSFELVAVAGNQIADGDTLTLGPDFTVQDTLNVFATIEAVVGVDLNLPASNQFQDGDVLTLVGATSSPTITFVDDVNPGPGEISLATVLTPDELAQAIVDATPVLLSPVNDGGGQVSILGVSAITTNRPALDAFVSTAATIPGAVPLLVNASQDSNAVAEALQDALVLAFTQDQQLTDPTLPTISETVFPIISGDRFRIFNTALVDQGPFGASIAMNALGGEFFTSSTPVEEFGEPRPNGFAVMQINTNAASGNEVQGVFIDDIIVGSTERGEIILNAPTGNFNFTLDPSFIPETRFTADPTVFPAGTGVNQGRGFQPEFPNQILSGGFTLEVRTGDEFGVERDLSPEELTLDASRGLGRSFDTNDRLTDGAVSLLATAGVNLLDGDTFVIDNGVVQLTFEFDSGDGVTAGNVSVPFNPISTSAGETAAAIRDAINSAQAFPVLGIRASTGDGAEVGPSSSSRVELFGDDIRVNPGEGRFILIDLVAEETFSGRATSRLFPVIDQDAETVVDTNFGSTQAQAVVTGFSNGDADVLVATGRIGDEVLVGDTFFQGPTLIDTNPPSADEDFLRIFLEAGQSIDLDIDAASFTRGADILNPLISVFNDDSALLAQSLPLAAAPAPGEAIGDAFLQFTAPADGFYVVGISSADLTTGDYQLTIRPSQTTQQVTIPAGQTGVDVIGDGLFVTVGGITNEFLFVDNAPVAPVVTADPDQVLVPVAGGDDATAIAIALSNQIATTFTELATTAVDNNVISVGPADNILPQIDINAPGVTALGPVATGTIIPTTSSLTLEFDDNLDTSALDGQTISLTSPTGVVTTFQFVDLGTTLFPPFVPGTVSVFFDSTMFPVGTTAGANVAAAFNAAFNFPGFPFASSGVSGNSVVLQAPTVPLLTFLGGTTEFEISGGPERDVLGVDYQFGRTDANRVNVQGQLIIANNIITDAAGSGIVATSGGRGQGLTTQGTGAVLTIAPDDLPRPGVAGLTANENVDGLVPGTVISNNLIVNPGVNGILFSGGTANDGETPAAVPIGRIVNNTVVSDGTGTGISVASNASPTLLNNLISGFAVGVDIDASSQDAGTVVAGNAFNNNTADANVPLSGTDIVIAGDVFEDPDAGVFIPVAGSPVIDSSFSALNDRPDFFATVTQPIGIDASPIIAPTSDVFGQPRFNDPTINPPGASGEIVTIDRGAVDRADFTAPVAVLTTPEDAVGSVVADGDQDVDDSFVLLQSGVVEFFEIQLLDPAGTGIDASTVTPQTVTLTENGDVLEAGVDFIFGFDSNSNTIRLTATAGQFLPDAVYEITLNNLDRTAIELIPGSEISDGDQVTITDGDGNVATFEFDSGFSVEVPQTTLLTVTGPNVAFNDGDVFSITGNGQTVNFEINTFGIAAPSNVAVDLTDATTISEVRDTILAVLQSNLTGVATVAQTLGLNPVAVGLDQIQLGTVEGTIGPNVIDGFEITGVAGGVVDGESFTLETNGNLQTFEFDSDGVVAADATAITITATDTPTEIAAAIVEAVNMSPFNNAVQGGPGIAVLGGNVGDQLDVTGSSLVASGEPGIAGALALSIPEVPVSALAGTTFSITVDGVEQEFLFSTDPTLISTTSQVIVLDPAFTPEEIATTIVPFIQAAIPALNPSAVGASVLIGESATTPATVDPGTAGLTVSGTSGGATAVSFLSTSSATSVAGALNAAIDAVVAQGGLNVNPFAIGGGSLLIDNATDVSFSGDIAALVTPTAAPALADLSGNSVLANRDTAETQFTIIFPEVTLDFGDAPDSFGTTLASNGPRNTIIADGPGLGVLIDSESDGVPSADSSGDDEPINVAVTVDPSSPFTTTTTANVTTVTLSALPTGGETLTVNVASTPQTFELVEVSENPATGNVAVFFSPTSTVESITASLVAALSGAIDQVGDGLTVEQVPGTGSLTITAIDDEDSILTGVNGDGIPVFLSSSTVDPANPDPSEVTGFFNLSDPTGTNVEVLVRGSGLLQIFVDFNGNGVFEDNEAEHPISNLPVTGDLVTGTPVTVNIPTPSSAVVGDTTLRVRISEQGDIGPDGVAIGGETEDFQVTVSDVPVPLPAPAGPFTTLEDTVLSSAADPSDLVGPLMTIPPTTTTGPPVSGFFLLVEQPADGTVLIDPVTGDFTFTPDADFSGETSFVFTVGLAPPSAPAGEVEPVASTAMFETVTINVDAVNDVPPVVQDVNFSFAESDQPGVGTPFAFTAAEVLNFASPISSTLSLSPATFTIVGFAVDDGLGGTAVATPPTGTGTLFLQSPAGEALGVGEVVGNVSPPQSEGGFFELNFVNGVFVDGLYFPPADFNTAFSGNPLFTGPGADTLAFVVSDDNGTPATVADDLLSDPATITFAISATNDAPSFEFDPNSPVENGVPTPTVLEDGLEGSFFIPGFVINATGGPDAAIDEQSQSVTFSFDPTLPDNAAAIASGLLANNQLPTVTADGDLTVIPAPDQNGSLTFVLTATDNLGATTDQTFGVNILPVNDPPQFASDIGIANPVINSPDDAFSVATNDFDMDGQIDDATITFTLREDDALSGGANGPGFFIPLTSQAAASAGFNRVGLLDVFNVGPADEAEPTSPAGNQSLSIDPNSVGSDGSAFGLGFRTTSLGGILEPVEGGFLYRPPQDVTVAFGFQDTFTYQVFDDNPGGGESFNLAGVLIEDQQVATNTVSLILNPVNDAPEFVPAFTSVTVQEDSATFSDLFAVNIAAGPASAIDENSLDGSGQSVSFDVQPISFSSLVLADLFTEAPSIDPVNGTLSFLPAPNVFGQFEFEVTLVDDGGDDATRGDVNTSDAVTLTINVNPVNDAPVLNPNVTLPTFEVLEDGSILIPVEGTDSETGLLDAFLPGPAVAGGSELANVAGGNQSVSLGSPIPTASAAQGSVTLITNQDGAQFFQYIPPANFVGTDSFIFTVIDDGSSADANGVLFADPEFASTVVSINVLPINDAPVFGSQTTVNVSEDDGPQSIANFVTGAFAGPISAVDEIEGNTTTPAQAIQFDIVQVAGSDELFSAAPTIALDADTGAGSLQFTSAAEASGTAVFEISLADNGPNDPGNGDQTVSVVNTFTINVAAVNDPPSFDLTSGTLVTTAEDSGAFSGQVIENILPGPTNPSLSVPSDEAGQIVTFDVSVPPQFQSLFSVQPTISSDGTLQFTPAPDQSTGSTGPVPITVTAQDNLGATTDSIELFIEITEVNDVPQAFGDQFATNEDSVLTITTAQLLANDVDDGIGLTVQLPAEQTLPSGAVVTFNAATGIITYDPSGAEFLQSLTDADSDPANSLFNDQFSYTIVDSFGVSSNAATVEIAVEGINDAPVSTVVPVSIGADGTATLAFPLGVTDVDTPLDPSSVSITLQPAFGSVEVLPNGNIVYTPFGTLTGTDIFQFTVADSSGVLSDVGTVTVTANAVPVAVDDTVVTFLGETLDINVTANDTDADGDLVPSSVVIVSQPLTGSVAVLADGTVQYTPAPTFVGTETFTYQVFDAEGVASNIATVTIQSNASRLQNPVVFSDVNNDGFVTPLDALLIINNLVSPNPITVVTPATPPGPVFFDANGDLSVTPLDALVVINSIIANNSDGVAAASTTIIAPTLSASSFDSASATNDLAATELASELDSGSGNLVDASGSSNGFAAAIDLIALESVDETDDDQSDESESAVDAAIESLISL